MTMKCKSSYKIVRGRKADAIKTETPEVKEQSNEKTPDSTGDGKEQKGAGTTATALEEEGLDNDF